MANELEASKDPMLIRKLLEGREIIERELEGSPCWESTYAKGHNGYCQIGHPFQGKRCGFLVHRLSWAYHYQKEIPRNKVVAHRCNNSICFNPDHLSLCSQMENVQFSVKVGRHRNQYM